MSSKVVGVPQTLEPRENGFYSMGSAIQNLEKVIGSIPDSIRKDFVHEQSRTHQDLTELLMNRASPVVTQIVTGLLLKTYVSPYTSLLLPIRQLLPYESLNVNWQEIHFDEGLANQVEVEGLARLYSHNKTKRGATAVRRGVAIKQESGFFMTPEGRELWSNQIKQLATIVQRTNDYDVMMTLLQTPMRHSHHANELGGPTNVYGSRRSMNLLERLKLEVDYFGIVNKSEDSRGFTNLVTLLRTTMVKNGCNPDVIIVPPNMLGYYLVNSDDLWQYSSAGPSNQLNRKDAVDIGTQSGIRTQVLQGMKIVDTYVSRMTDGENESASDLMTLPKQIGEYYPMLTKDVLEFDCSSFEKFQSRNRQIRIFNEEQGRIVPIKYSECIKNCLRWDDSDVGNLNKVAHEDTRIHNDLFLYNNGEQKDVAEQWIDMSSENLTEESLDNVISSVVGKFEKQVIMEVCKNLDEIQLLTDNDVKATIYTNGVQNVYPTDKKNLVKYYEALNAKIGSLWSNIYNNFLSKFLGCCASDGNNNLQNIVKNYVYCEKKNNGKTEKTFFHWVFDCDTKNKERRKRWLELLNHKNYAERLIGYTFLISNITRKNMLMMDHQNYYVPIDFILFRPWMTYNVSSTIVMKSGSETGETVIGDQKFELTSNISDRTLYGNYFYYGKAIVKKDRNVMVAPSVFIQNYIKGNNTTFVTEKQLSAIRDESGLIEDSRSILAIMTKVNDPVSDSNVIDIRGTREGLKPPNNKESFYATSDYYNALFNIDSTGLQDPLNDFNDYEDINIRANSICFLGHVENANGKIIHKNTGHLGPNVYDGVHLSRTPGRYSTIRNIQLKY